MKTLNISLNPVLMRNIKKSMLLLLSLVIIPGVMAQDDMQDAQIELTFNEEEKTITAKVMDTSGVPAEAVELYFYVKRTFSNLPIGDVFNETDENGEVTVQFPADLPGDEDGNVELIVKIQDSDMFNDQTMTLSRRWGVPTELDFGEDKRSLWAAAANAPIPLVIIVSSLIVLIWYVICYILYSLYKLSKIKPEQT